MQTKITVAQLAQQDPRAEIAFVNASGVIILSASEAVDLKLGHLQLDPPKEGEVQLSDEDYNRIA